MTTLKYAGNGTSKDFLKDVKGMIVLDRGTTTTPTAAKTLAGWIAHICPALAANITGTYISLARGFEDKSTAPEFTTANTGFKEKTKDFAPEFVGYGFMSFEDYRTWFAADGKEYNFVMLLADGSLMAPLDSSGNVVGFDGRIFVTFGLPKPGGDGKQKACPIDVILDDVEQIKNYQIIRPSFTRRELEEIVPVGINIEVLTAYNAGTLVLKATHRVSGLPYAGFLSTALWHVVTTSTDATSVIAFVSVTALGVTTVTVYVTGTTPMTGDFEIQAEAPGSGAVTYLSNVLNIPV